MCSANVIKEDKSKEQREDTDVEEIQESEEEGGDEFQDAGEEQPVLGET